MRPQQALTTNFDQSKVHFKIPPQGLSSVKFHIHNPTDREVQYKLWAIHKKLYDVNPNGGKLGPGESAEITITFMPSTPLLPLPNTHQFKLVSFFTPEDPYEVKQIWAEMPIDVIMKRLFLSTHEMEMEEPPEPLETKEEDSNEADGADAGAGPKIMEENVGSFNSHNVGDPGVPVGGGLFEMEDVGLTDHDELATENDGRAESSVAHGPKEKHCSRRRLWCTIGTFTITVVVVVTIIFLFNYIL